VVVVGLELEEGELVKAEDLVAPLREG